MRKYIALVLALVCVLGLCACNSNTSPNHGAAPEAYAFEAQYIRTNGYSEERSYPYHVVINSKEELDAYLKDFEIKGHGGTDFRPVFEYVAKLREEGELKKLKGLLYFTDGYGEYPKKKTPYDTVFVFPERDYVEQDVPPWAMKLVLLEEQIMKK